MDRSLARALADVITASLDRLEEDSFYGPVYKMDVRKDRFIHFTTQDRAKQILEAGKLLMDPPYKKFGADHVAAVSLVWGAYVPGVQTTHIGSKDLVGLIFKTNKRPDSGHPEEVVWHFDVPIKNPKVVSLREGIRLLKRADTPQHEDFEVRY